MPVTQEHIDTARRIARSYGATRLLLFGRGATDPEAARDLDIAIEGVPGWAIWELAGRLEREVDVPVDVIPLDEDTPFLRHIEQVSEDIPLDA